jgi:hypothetical protein
LFETTMSASSIRSRLETVIALARLLERVEAGETAANADQYRALVQQLQAALSEQMPDDVLRAILGAHPAASDIYENLHYRHAGLSRAPLERSASSEVLTRQLLARVAGQARDKPSPA